MSSLVNAPNEAKKKKQLLDHLIKSLSTIDAQFCCAHGRKLLKTGVFMGNRHVYLFSDTFAVLTVTPTSFLSSKKAFEHKFPLIQTSVEANELLDNSFIINRGHERLVFTSPNGIEDCKSWISEIKAAIQKNISLPSIGKEQIIHVANQELFICCKSADGLTELQQWRSTHKLININTIIDNTNENTLLYVASSYGQEHIVEFLLKERAEVNKAQKIGSTSLHVAAWRGNLNVCKMLLEHGADLTIVNRFNETPRDNARNRNFGEIEELFLNYEKSRRTSDEYSSSTNSTSSTSNNNNSNSNSDINEYDEITARRVAKSIVGVTAEVIRARKIVEESKTFNNTLNSTFKSNTLPTTSTITTNTLPTISNSTTATTTAMTTAMTTATTTMPTNTTSLNPDIEALFTAARTGDSEVFRNWVRINRNMRNNLVQIKNQDGDTVLHVAAQHGFRNIIMFVSAQVVVPTDEYVSTVDYPNNVNGNTPLHVAAQSGQESTCRTLLDLGASPSSKNLADETPSDCALKLGFYKIARVIDGIEDDVFGNSEDDENIVTITTPNPFQAELPPFTPAITTSPFAPTITTSNATISTSIITSPTTTSIATEEQEPVRRKRISGVSHNDSPNKFNATTSTTTTSTTTTTKPITNGISRPSPPSPSVPRGSVSSPSPASLALIEEIFNACKNNDIPYLQKMENKSKDFKKVINTITYCIYNNSNDNNSNLNTFDFYLLHFATYHRNTKIVAYLVSKGADVNATENSGGNSALHIAVIRQCIDICKLLLTFRANTNIRNKDGKTAIEIAANLQSREYISLLLTADSM